MFDFSITFISTYTKLIVYFMIRLIGRLKPGLHKQSPPAETEEIQPAQAGFALRVSAACAQRKRLCSRCFNRPVKLIRLYIRF